MGRSALSDATVLKHRKLNVATEHVLGSSFRVNPRLRVLITFDIRQDDRWEGACVQQAGGFYLLCQLGLVNIVFPVCHGGVCEDKQIRINTKLRSL